GRRSTCRSTRRGPRSWWSPSARSSPSPDPPHPLSAGSWPSWHTERAKTPHSAIGVGGGQDVGEVADDLAGAGERRLALDVAVVVGVGVHVVGEHTAVGGADVLDAGDLDPVPLHEREVLLDHRVVVARALGE